MSKLEEYPKYKESGVEWLREIPEEWEIKKLFDLCHFIRGNSSFNKDELLSNGKYVALQYGKTYKVDDIDEKYEFYVNDEFYKNSQIVNFGDTIFISTSETIEDLGHSAYYKRSDLGLLGGEQILLKPKRETINSKFLYFFSKVFSKELRKYATGIKVFRFNINDLKTIYISVPPKQEQTKIANYLDQKIAQIDKAISLKEQMIERLKERRQILINDVVTKGLDKTVKMKDSGVKWLGKVPEHWEITIAKHALKKLTRPRKQNGNTVICSNHGYSKLLGDVKQGLVSLTQHDYQGVNEGDLLIHGMDIWHGAIAISKHTGDCTSVVHVCDSKHNKTYIAYFLKMLAINNVYKIISHGVRQNTSDFRSWQKFGDIQLLLPSKEEQKEIAEYIETQTKRIDKALELQQNYIEKLKEYKNTLIDSVVTGKVRACDD